MIRMLVAALLGVIIAAQASAQTPPTTQCVSTAVATGTSDALVIPQLPCVPTTTLLVLTTPQANTTTTPTITAAGSPPQVVKRYTGMPLVAGDFPAGGHTMLTNNGQNWFLLTFGGGTGAVTSVDITSAPCLVSTPNPITNTGTIASQIPQSVPCGGTGDTTLTAHSPLLGEGTSSVVAAAVGTAGRYLRDNGSSADASFSAIPLADLPTLTCAVLPAGGCPFDIVMFMPGVPGNSAIVRVAIPRNVSCPTGFTGSVGIAKESATASTVVNVNQVTSGTGTLRGTLTWAGSGTVATVASSGGMTLAANDIVEFAFPATADATLGDIAITLKCART